MVDLLRDNLPILNESKMIILKGEGGKAFCAGGDVKSLL